MENQIDWSKANLEDYELASKIVKRANRIKGFGKVNAMSLQMDIIAVHISGCELKLKELLDSALADFAHDICGIIHNIDRDNGELLNCFLPRYAK